MEQSGAYPFQPSRPLLRQIHVQPDQSPALEHLRRRDPGLWHPLLQQQLPQVTGVSGVGLRSLLWPPAARPCRFRQVHLTAHSLQLLHHVPPASACLHRERHRFHFRKPRQPRSQVIAIRRPDLPPPNLSGLGLDVVVGQLPPMNVNRA